MMAAAVAGVLVRAVGRRLALTSARRARACTRARALVLSAGRAAAMTRDRDGLQGCGVQGAYADAPVRVRACVRVRRLCVDGGSYAARGPTWVLVWCVAACEE